MSEEVEDDTPACAKERCKTKHGLGDHRDAERLLEPKDDSDEGISSPEASEAEAEEGEEEGELLRQR